MKLPGGKIEVQNIPMFFFNMYGVFKCDKALAIVRVRWYSWAEKLSEVVGDWKG